VHDYLGVDLKLLWKVVENRLPELAKAIDELIQNLEKS